MKKLCQRKNLILKVCMDKIPISAPDHFLVSQFRVRSNLVIEGTIHMQSQIPDRQPVRTSIFILVIFLLVGLAPCIMTASSKELNSSSNLCVDPATRDFSENPALLLRILSSPHGYFRFINIPFSNDVCQRFTDELDAAPSFNLHGDAHLEQYAVTDLGRGLTDFDDSSVGPAILDLMRFAVSLHIACRIKGWQKDAEALYDEFLRGYRQAILDPPISAPEPSVAKGIRSTFKSDKVNYFKWVDSLMEPVPRKEQEELTTAMGPYIQVMFVENPQLPSQYFRVDKIGYLRMGIGSALDRKYLLRCRGMTDDPFDDLVLEAKEIRDISGIRCLIRFRKSDPFRILVGQARIAYQPFHHLGYFRFRHLTFWIHSWVENYKEVDINRSFQTVEQLKEVAFDIGIQLGKGHPKQIAAPLGLQIRYAQLRWLDQHQQKMKSTCRQMTDEVIQCWKFFCSRVDATPTTITGPSPSSGR